MQVVEIEVPYTLHSGNVQFTPQANMDGTVYLYYKLTDFYQNHRRYVKSRSDQQLRGYGSCLHAPLNSICLLLAAPTQRVATRCRGSRQQFRFTLAV